MVRKPEVLEEKLHSLQMNLVKLIEIREGLQVLDVGCGQGTFTACVAKLVGETGNVVTIDISDEYLGEMNQNLDKYGVKHRVKFVKADATDLSSFLVSKSFDIAVSYRLIEELTKPEKLPKIIVEIAKMVRQNGMVAMIELSTETRSAAEENLIRLHRDIGDDYFPDPREVLKCMKNAGLTKVCGKTVETDIWYSATLFLKGTASQDRIWNRKFRERIMKDLWPSIKQHGIKYPPINVFIGQKTTKYDMNGYRD